MADHEKLDQAEQSLNRLVRRQHYDESNRLTLLILHGVGAIFVGLLLSAGEPPQAWRDMVPNGNMDWILWLPALTGGLFLLSGLWNNRNLVLELVGMCLIAAWDIMMVLVFINMAKDAGTNAALYPISVYTTLCSLMAVHIRTVLKYMRQGKP